MNRFERPTLEDVATAAGVSTATISRAINEPEKVAEVTRNRIQSIIQKLGYTPNYGGKILASNRSNTVGAVIPTMANAMFASGLQAFQEALAEAGVTLLVASSGYSSKQEFHQIRSLITHGADGLLLIGASRPKETREFLTLTQVPYVMSWCYKSDPGQFFAGFDNTEAAHQITDCALSLGHQRIAMIAGKSRDNDRAKNRIQGVKRAIKNTEKKVQLVSVIETGYSMENGGDAFEELMSLPKPPTAVICGNDVLAAGAVVRAKQTGVNIPRDVSITGFDDITLSTAVSPALTTVRVPHSAMGTAAATLLLKLLAGEPKPASIKIDTEIVTRDSLAPPTL